MVATLPKSFWPDDIKISNVLSPIVILRQAAGQLASQTGNLLEGRLTSIQYPMAGEEGVEHTLDVVAPALDRYSRTILRATHQKMLAYPVFVDDGEGQAEMCSTQDEFVQCIAKILSSPNTRGVLYGLGAKINERAMQAEDSTSQGSSANE